MASHFSKVNGLKNNMVKAAKNPTPTYMQQMIVREQVDRKDRLHPDVKRRWNQMTQEPQPLKFKLHDLQGESVDGDSESTYKLFEKYKNFHVNEPLKPLEPLPFIVERTHRSNLPVYSDYKMGGQQKRTIVRNITGDINQFKEELAKVVSNSPITEKMGRVEISGIHTTKVKYWLTRLGF